MHGQVTGAAALQFFFHLQNVPPSFNQLDSDWPWSSQLDIIYEIGADDVSFKLNWFLVRGSNSLSGRQILTAASFFSGQSCCLCTISRHGKLIADGYTHSCLCFLPTLAWCCSLLFASSIRGSDTDVILLKSWNFIFNSKQSSLLVQVSSLLSYFFWSFFLHGDFFFSFLRDHGVEEMIPGATPKAVSLVCWESQLLITSRDVSYSLLDNTKLVWLPIGILVVPQAG